MNVKNIMHLIKNILPRLFALWAAIIFVITMLPVGLAMWIIGVIDEPKRTIVFQAISKTWMQLFFVIVGCRLRITGKEHFAPGENYIIVSNHNSFMDVPLTTPFIPGPNKTIAKIEISKVPVFGLIYKRGAILLDRKDKNSRKESFRKMKQVLAMGMHMCIYPEGTRNRTPEPLKTFHDGAFSLAIDTKKAILPAILFNTKKVLPPEKTFYFWPSKMEIHFLAPIRIAAGDSIDELKERVFKIMAEHYSANI
jgi:1-acyl-sn-glycerol-3-phosphate acyltransferase